MNKAEIIKAVAAKENIKKEDAQRYIDSFLDEITASLRDGEEVTLVGFGSFTVKTRVAHDVVDINNTSERIAVPEIRLPVFKPGKNLKEAVR